MGAWTYMKTPIYKCNRMRMREWIHCANTELGSIQCRITAFPGAHDVIGSKSDISDRDCEKIDKIPGQN